MNDSFISAQYGEGKKWIAKMRNLERIAHLQVTVDHPVDLEIVVIVTERVEQRLRYSEPAHVEKEL